MSGMSAISDAVSTSETFQVEVTEPVAPASLEVFLVATAVVLGVAPVARPSRPAQRGPQSVRLIERYTDGIK